MDFPPIDKFYEDEFGKIDPEVYRTGSDLWNSRAEYFAEKNLRDINEGCRLMIKAIANVSRYRAENPSKIENLSAYLFDSFKHLIFAESKKESNRRRILAEAHLPNEINEEERILRKIEVKEMLGKLDAATRELFEMHYIFEIKYEELVPRYGSAANVIRSKLNKALSKLRKGKRS